MTGYHDRVKTAMLAIQRYPWEQGICAQAMVEAGETETFVAMAHDAVLRSSRDGRLAMLPEDGVAVTDPAAVGEAVWRAFKVTGDDFYKNAAEKMLDYYMKNAPRTSCGLICHNTVSFVPEHSPEQIWVDSCYMLPPFLAVMGEFDEARRQFNGYFDCLYDSETGVLFHIYDAGQGRFVRKKRWATGNGWALLALARLTSLEQRPKIREEYITKGNNLLDSMRKYTQKTGLFCDILDEPNESFEDGASSMMAAAFVYRGIAEGWLNAIPYLESAESVYEQMQKRIDKYGIIRGVCGCPHFDSPGTSAEAQAFYIMMEIWRDANNETGQVSESIAFD
ncbi:MAG: glycoside hydrolase family 88 protein [Oscillospiraceae bacterium]|nr:glycoside hydrolase family 88 protein [Oscillospiraceae bacterium]